jgi:hypothetical protein
MPTSDRQKKAMTRYKLKCKLYGLTPQNPQIVIPNNPQPVRY